MIEAYLRGPRKDREEKILDEASRRLGDKGGILRHFILVPCDRTVSVTVEPKWKY
jgi:hypothetical protein